MKDLCFTTIDIGALVMAEHLRQLRKWGVQNHSPFEWLAFATEEIGELSNAISEHHWRGGHPEAVAKEAIQAATLCLKIAEMYLSLPQEKHV